MHLIMTTFAFLIIFSIFSYAQLQKLKENYTAESVYASYFQKMIDDAATAIATNARTTFRALDPNRIKKPRGKKLISYLHISSLIQPNALPQQTAESKAAKILLKGTILALYGDKTFFIEAGMNDAEVDNFIDTLFLNAKDLPTKNFLKSPEALANVNLNNKTYEGILYKMLKGNIPPKDASSTSLAGPENYKSLADFIRFEKTSSMISVYLAPEEVLRALFKNPTVVQEVINARNNVYQELKKEKEAEEAAKDKNKTPGAGTTPLANNTLDEKKKTFEGFRELLVDGIDKNLIDFSASLSDPDDYL